jgi:hypothetical protein
MSKFTSTTSSTSEPNKRFTGTLLVDPTLMGKLIGRGGCNIRRITSAVRAGCYIRGDDGTFQISAWTKQAVLKAAQMLKLDQAALKDPAKRPSKPFALFKVDSHLVPHIVGRGGDGLRTIMSKVGDGCYIVHRDDAFHITANSSSDLQFAKTLILQQKRAFIHRQTSHDEEVGPQLDTHSYGSFTALQLDSSDDENQDENQDDQDPLESLFNTPYVSHFPQMEGSDASANVTLEISDTSIWSSKPQLPTRDLPMEDSDHVSGLKLLRAKQDLQDSHKKYNTLTQTTRAKAALLTGDQRTILLEKADRYSQEVDRLELLIGGTRKKTTRISSWADAADSDSD